jgi:hypothetical protein
MKLYINTYQGKKVAKLVLLNEFGEPTKTFVGFLNERSTQNGSSFEYCELRPVKKLKVNNHE